MPGATDEFLDSLPDPDIIGQAAYRAVHEHIHDVADSCRYDGLEDAETLEIIIVELDELAGWARDLKDKAQRHLRS